MVDIERAIITHSVEDVLSILENEPVKVDLVLEVTAVQVMNRMSIAHLSIERALKFLITSAGGQVVRDHDLRDRYQELLRHDPVSAKFLGEAFEAAVRHYRYNPNAVNMRHLKAIELYLGTCGSDQAFEDIRYWELAQSRDEILLRRIYLSLHIELLYGLRQIFLAAGGPMETVVSRVERAVKDAMWFSADVVYSSGNPQERSVHSYVEWRRGFSTWSEALACAVKKGFNIGDDFVATQARNAYKILLEATDPAVRYFASTLDVLKRQPRDAVPCVEWLGPEKERRGTVTTPAGTPLGIIERGPDGLWYITPLGGAAPIVAAKAGSQTDARCYLALMLTRPAQFTVEGESKSLRIVGEKHDLFQQKYDRIDWSNERVGDDKVWTYKVTLWDKHHGIRINDQVRVEVRSEDRAGVIDILEGTVTEVTEHEVYLSGYKTVRMDQRGRG